MGFFFSSRRRHTRCSRDWSSDVCSSDLPASVFEQVRSLAASRGVIFFCDEVYRELEHDPADRLPAACEVYERAVSLGSMSKTYGLPGLRLGWLVSKDADILRRCLELKYYTTICTSAPSEFLSALALRHRQVLVERNREIVLRNLPLLDSFFERRSDLFEWVKPNASPIGFVRYKPQRDVLSFRSEEHTSELQSRLHLVCRLLLEKKKKNTHY